MSSPSAHLLCFGPFTLDLAAAQLRRDGAEVALRPKAYELLVALARRPQELVTKEELLDSVWGRRFITEGVIKSSVSELRQALGDDPKAPQWIETVARRGYRFGGVLHAGTAAAGGAHGVPLQAQSLAQMQPQPQPQPQPPAPGANPQAGNVPAPLSPALGREAEIDALAGLLHAQRLITITGPAGIGKTRLAQALAWAQRPAWRDGVWFVELALHSLAPTESADAAQAMLRAALVQTLQLSSGAGASSATLARALQPLHLLLVLDNAEHLLAPLASLLDTLLAQAPALHVVVTSQEPLRLAGEQLLRLQPLTLPAPEDDDSTDQLMACSAVRLFVARVASRLPGFSLGPHQRQAVAHICRELDGLPLALELAAARVPMLGVHGMADLLQAGGDRLQLLTQGARTAAPRQRTLRGALGWSHGLLDERQRRVLRRLAVFRGGFALTQAQAVCGDDTLDGWGVLDAVQALMDKSLLSAPEEIARSAPSVSATAPRLRMLESVRAFALEKLVEAGEAEATAARHLQAVAAYWQRADADAIGHPALHWLTLHAAETDNLRAALQWASAAGRAGQQADTVALLAVHGAMLWQRLGSAAEGRHWCDLAKGLLPSLTGDIRGLSAGLDLAQATLSVYANAYPPAQGLACAQRAAEHFAAAGDVQRGGYALYLVYQSTLRVDGTAPLAALLTRMQALAAQEADRAAVPGFGLARYQRAAEGYEHRRAGRSAEYLAYCRGELAYCQHSGALVEGWAAAQGLMLAEHDAGRPEAALAVGRQALAEIRAQGRLRQHGAFFALWATVLAESGDTAATRVALMELLPTLRGAGTLWMAHVALAWLAAQESRPLAAARLLGRHDAAQETEVRARAGGTIDRSLQALVTRLGHELDAAAMAQERLLGAALDDAGAERLALQKGASAP